MRRQGFLPRLESGDHDRAVKMIDPQSLKVIPEAKARAIMQGQQEHMQSCGGLKSVDVKLAGSGETRVGTFTMAFASCASASDKISVRKVSGTWTITIR
jgi:hypothetical protein